MYVVPGVGYIQHVTRWKKDRQNRGGWCMMGNESLPIRGVCASVRNSCKRSSDWFPSFDRHLIPLGRKVGQGKGPAVGDEKFWGWEVLKQASVYGCALTLPPFFLSLCRLPPLPPSWHLLPSPGCAAVSHWCGPRPGFDEPATPDCSQEGAENGE